MTADKSTTTLSAYREFVIPLPDLSEIGECGDPVGVLEMAQRLGIQDRSVHMIRRRGQLPRPDYEQVNGSRAWEWSTILWWAGETDRLRNANLVRQYRETFGVDPPRAHVSVGSAGGANGRQPTRTPPGTKAFDDKRPTVPKVPGRDELTARRAK